MGLDITFWAEFRYEGDLHLLNISKEEDIRSVMRNRCYETFALFGPKWRDDYKHYPTLPFLHDLEPCEDDYPFGRMLYNNEYDKNKYAISRDFAIEYDPHGDGFLSKVIIAEALAFDYDQIAVDGLTWRDILDDWWFLILDYFKNEQIEHVFITFGF